MKYWYSRKQNGKLVKLAKIYTKEEHKIDKKLIDYKAIQIINKLISLNHQTYIVGGAIRDFLSGRIPKDFDIVTDAHPRQIKKYFNRSQIIGKRFPIVLIPDQKNRFIEIATFRSASLEQTKEQNSSLLLKDLDQKAFGTIEQDVTRRDFTCNALYYCAKREEIFDFVDGVEHLQKKKLVSIRTKFQEDPVRMIRAIKYASKVSLTISYKLCLQIYINAPLIKYVSHSRIGDEVIKILTTGNSTEIFSRLLHYRLLKYMLPNIYIWYKKNYDVLPILFRDLQKADKEIDKRYSRIRGLAMLIQQYVLYLVKNGRVKLGNECITKASMIVLIDKVKTWLHPITPPNSEVHRAIMSVLESEGFVSFHSRARLSKKFSKR